MVMTRNSKLGLLRKTYKERDIEQIKGDVLECLKNPHIYSSGGEYQIVVTYVGEHTHGAPSVEVGEEFDTMHGKITILSYDKSTAVSVQFSNTGSIINTSTTLIKRGKVSDPFVPTVCGIGYEGQPKEGGNTILLTKGGKVGKARDKARGVWTGILDRCYNPNSPSYPRYGQVGTVVCDEWHNYQNFQEWFVSNHKEGFQVDKDLRDPTKKVYSPDTCEFIPALINSLICGLVNRKKDGLPLGVSLPQKGVGYKAQVVRGGGSEGLGIFSTPEDAFASYKKAKEDYIKGVAIDYFKREIISHQIYTTLMEFEILPYPLHG